MSHQDRTNSNTGRQDASPTENGSQEGTGVNVPETTCADGAVLAAARVGYLTADFAHLVKRGAVDAMTVEGWYSCCDPLAMLSYLHRRASGRKFRLFATACARDEFAHGVIPEGECPGDRLPQYYEAIEGAEAYADGGPSPPYRFPFHWVTFPVCDVITHEDVAHAALGFNADVGLWLTPIEVIVPRIISRYHTHPAHYIRDIFGFIFHQPTFDNAWRTPTVRAVAEAAYEVRQMPVGYLEPDRLGVLADSLEEAGCIDDTLLGHLRSAGPHVRGCWAVDLVLGKS